MFYKYIHSWEKLEEKSLPPKGRFFSKPKNEEISDGNCKHVEGVKNAFKLKEIKEYVHLYNMQDVLISLAVNIDFMKNMPPKFDFNPLNFVTLASFSWEYALKMTKIELQLPTDVDTTILDYENCIRGEITKVTYHYAEIINTSMIMMKLKKVHTFNILILTIKGSLSLTW